MAEQRQEIAYVVTGFAATLYFDNETRRLEVKSIEEMHEILRRQDSEGDQFYQIGMEFATLMEGPNGVVEEEDGFSESSPPGTIMYRWDCKCGAYMWLPRRPISCLHVYECERCHEERLYNQDQQRLIYGEDEVEGW